MLSEQHVLVSHVQHENVKYQQGFCAYRYPNNKLNDKDTSNYKCAHKLLDTFFNVCFACTETWVDKIKLYD